MSNKIQPADEFFRDCMGGGQSVYTENQRKFLEKAILFAQQHVNAAKSEISIKAKTKTERSDDWTGTDNNGWTSIPMTSVVIDKDSIINAYPIKNIK